MKEQLEKKIYGDTYARGSLNSEKTAMRRTQGNSALNDNGLLSTQKVSATTQPDPVSVDHMLQVGVLQKQNDQLKDKVQQLASALSSQQRSH